MKVSCFSAIALVAACGVSAGDLTPSWKKLTYSLGLMELNLNYDRTRVDNYYAQAALKGVDGNPLNGTEKAVAEILLRRLTDANHMQIVALSDLRGYLYWPEKNPEQYYGADKRYVESIDFHLPEGFLDTQGVFNDRDGLRPISDIPSCQVCPITW
ncbi:hypothetical protein NUW58_g136 [Xylaria curta]|uniref:Uncharacterized protein n=2 Tax=Xylaria curta TaxID=42375 RepID=A0ACC1PTN0_9PEZI|nr:hypothetical protein NUW58_g7359 [Xylaria curta]KAJ2998993.1 hypothetical protein NUW58_g136 [Xylaria curta]